MLRKKNNAALASDLLLYSNSVAAALCYHIDKRVCFLYGLAYVLLQLLFPPPMHKGASLVSHPWKSHHCWLVRTSWTDLRMHSHSIQVEHFRACSAVARAYITARHRASFDQNCSSRPSLSAEGLSALNSQLSCCQSSSCSPCSAAPPHIVKYMSGCGGDSVMACQTSGTALRAAGQGHDSGRPPRPAQAPGGQPAGHDVRALVPGQRQLRHDLCRAVPQVQGPGGAALSEAQRQ